MSFTIHDYDLRKSFNVERKILLFCGFYPRRTSKYSYLYFFAAATNLFITIGQLVTMIVQMVINRNDLSKLSDALQCYISIATFTCKLANFVFNGKILLKLEDTLTLPIFYGFSNDKLQMLQEKVQTCKLIGNIFRVLCSVATVFYFASPYLDPTKHGELPFPAWFPYNVTKHYYSAYVFQLLGMVNPACMNSAIDILTWMLISLASGQFDILKENLKRIDYRNKNLEQTEESFKSCVKHHMEIVKYVSEIENMFSRGIFLQFFASVVVICFTGFMMMIVPVFSSQFGFLVMYFMAMMCQVAMYCWYGHDVMTKSDTIGKSFYVSNWYESDMSIRKSVSIFLEKTKKPVTLTAGGYVTLSLTTLTGILRSSYSYFAVLQRLYNG